LLEVRDAMTNSKMIASLIGPTLVAIAAAMLLNLDTFPAVAEQVSRDPALIFLSGVLVFVAGLAIVRAHNVWAGGWPVLVTILGWLAIVGGLARMLFPLRLAAMAAAFAQSTGLMIAGAVVLLALGAFLSFKAYGRDASEQPAGRARRPF
jgi:cytochrome bd-type quinol oxidase subunit 2